MDIRKVSPDDLDTLNAIVELERAALAADTPWRTPWLPEDYITLAQIGWDGEPPVIFAGEVDGVLVTHCDAWMSEYDNRHLVWMHVRTALEHRRKGYATTIFEHAERYCAELGRTSIGTDGFDTDDTLGFTESLGLKQAASEVFRRQHLRKVDEDLLQRLLQESEAASADYELIEVVGPVPEELIEAYAEMSNAINDAPTEGLDVEDEVFDAARIRAYEKTQEVRHQTLYRVIARHRPTGELVGHTAVAVKRLQPWQGYQHDTTVVRDHRGHRLGLRLKARMAQVLREMEPELEYVDTTNAGSNDHMIAVNERLGYEVMGRSLEFQRDIRG